MVRVDDDTFIMRQSKDVNYEAPFLYLLCGAERAILLDTGAAAGGGVGGGQVIGATDAVGLRAEEDKTHVHDVHATILHLLGFNHRKLTFRHDGRNERLTDNAGEVIHKALA